MNIKFFLSIYQTNYQDKNYTMSMSISDPGKAQLVLKVLNFG